MKVKEIIELEKANAYTDRIILVQDGSFWRAYEYSAQRFSEKIAPSFQVRGFSKFCVTNEKLTLIL